MPLLELVDFAGQFTWLARKCIDEAPGVRASTFSSRQSIAIASLGTARILRNMKQLGVGDLVELAVTTSPPEAQGYSEMIALRLLMGDERDIIDSFSPEEVESVEMEAEKQSLTGKKLLLKDILDYLQFASSVDRTSGESHLDFLRELESEIFSERTKIEKQGTQERLDAARKRTAFEMVGGRKGITKRGIDSWEQLMDKARRNITQSIPSIDRSTMAKAQLLGMTQEISKLARENMVRQIAEILSQTERAEEHVSASDISKKLDTLTDNQLSHALRTLQEYQSLLKRMNIPEQAYAPSLDKITTSLEERVRERSKSLHDIITHPELFRDNIDRERMSEILETSWHEESPLDSLHAAKQADDLIDTGFSERMYDMHKEAFEKLELDDYLQHIVPSPAWINGMESAMEKFESEGPSWDDRFSVAERMKGAYDAESRLFPIGQDMYSYLESQVSDMIQGSQTKDQLTESVEFAKDSRIELSPSEIKTKGEELGMTPVEIAHLLGGAYELLKGIITSGDDPSFERVRSILDRARLSFEQMDDLVKESVKHKSAEALGAFASQNLQGVIQSLPKSKEAKDLLEQGLGAGGGENILMQWFKHGSSLPRWARVMVKRIAKEVMIKLAKARAAALIGSSEAGPIPEGSTRPYVIGDDLDSIDLDETIDNIIISGKRSQDIETSDFIVRENISGRRCVVFLVDISGSMTGAPLAGASIATAMLLFAFSRDELGVALFESNSHIICEVGKQVDIDEVVDEILDLRAQGGTQMQAALEWSEEQLLKSRSSDKMFVMATDAHIGDFDRSSENLRNISDMGVSSILIVPGQTYGLGNIQGIVNNSNAHLIVVKDWSKFPEIVSKILSRS